MEHNLKVGQSWEARRPRRTMLGLSDFFNDRQILWVGSSEVQYDSPSVARGRHYPKLSIEKFLAWAGREVTAEMPKDDWREWKNK